MLDEVGYEGIEQTVGIGTTYRGPTGEVGYIGLLLYGSHCAYVEGMGATLKR